MYDKYWDALVASLWSPESWIKVVFLLVTSPIWVPVLRRMASEVQEVLAPEGGLFANREPRPIARRPAGEDPFLSIPLAARRRERRAQRDGVLATRSVRAAEPRGTREKAAPIPGSRPCRQPEYPGPLPEKPER